MRAAQHFFNLNNGAANKLLPDGAKNQRAKGEALDARIAGEIDAWIRAVEGIVSKGDG